MDNYLQNIDVKKRKSLRRKITFEYLLFIIAILFIYLLLPFLLDTLVGDKDGLDNIGYLLVISVILRFIKYVVLFILLILYPIIILIRYKNEYKQIVPKFKKRISIFLTILPIFFSLLIIFEVPLSNLMYYLQYEFNINSYNVSYEEYKLPIEFYNELKDRNLSYNGNTVILKNKLNSNHDCRVKIKDSFSYQNCYEKSTMFGINEERYSDSINNFIVSNMYEYPSPVYMYNAILTLPSKNEKLQYAALELFSDADYYGDYDPKENDYYIECKIMYVDGDIYAIIGLGQSDDVTKYNDVMDDALFNYNYPYNMIISENKKITTFVDDKYYKNGGIENLGKSYEMVEKNKVLYSSLYPIRKVDKLDLDTINEIAKELQNGVLKQSIEMHFSQ